MGNGGLNKLEWFKFKIHKLCEEWGVKKAKKRCFLSTLLGMFLCLTPLGYSCCFQPISLYMAGSVSSAVQPKAK